MVVIPQITVQHDISMVLEDVRDGVVDSGWEDVWVSCYKEGHTSVHGKLRISKSAGGVAFDAREGIEWSGSSAAEFKVACSSLDINPTPIRLPKQTYGPPNSQKSKKVTAFCVSPDGNAFALGYSDGSVAISSSHSSQSIRTGSPHLSVVLSMRFFPSSVVLLSTSSDHSVRIHDAQLSQPPSASPSADNALATVRTLQAHSAGVTGCAIVERGKNVVSFGRDATARLWNVGEAKEVVGRRWRAPKGSPILCGCLDEKWQEADCDSEGGVVEGQRNPQTALDGEVGTEGKVVFVGLQDGSVRGYLLSTGDPIFYSSGSSPGGKASPVDSICYSRSTSTLAAGRRDGSVTAWNLRDLNRPPVSSQQEGDPGPLAQEEFFDCTPSWSFRRNTAGIECLVITESMISPTTSTQSPDSSEAVGLLVGSADGLFCRIGLKPQGGVVLVEEFIGIESGDGVRGVQSVIVDGLEIVWCAADDGLVRRY